MAQPILGTVNGRDPEDRWIPADDPRAIREKMLDKTLADSYPASDPPSSLPDPSVDSLAMSVQPSVGVNKAARLRLHSCEICGEDDSMSFFGEHHFLL